MVERDCFKIFLWKKALACLILTTFFTTTILPSQYAQAQVLNPVSQIVPLTPAYQPAVLQGMVIHSENPLNFDFIMNFGDSSLEGQALKDESQKLVKYFIASLATSEKDMWVNLSPYEPDRIVPQVFGQTEMGRDMLAQDYLLKQITASLMHPDDETGKKFWEKIYQTAYEQYGTIDIPVDTFNKVWIVPQTTTVYENGATNTVFVSESTLDVMLESDYLAQTKSQSASIVAEGKAAAGERKDLSDQAKQIIKEIILPALKQEVNEGKNFAPLRQIMNSLILAKWYKDAFKNSILNQEFANQEKTAGTKVADPNAKQKIYEQYVQAFQQGAYDVLKEDYDPAKQELVTKRYFSGGVAANKINVQRDGIPVVNDSNDFAMLGTNLAMMSGKVLSIPTILSLVVFILLSSNLSSQSIIPLIISPRPDSLAKTTIKKKLVRIHRDLSRPSPVPEEFQNKNVITEWEKITNPDGTSYWEETLILPEEELPSKPITPEEFNGKDGDGKGKKKGGEKIKDEKKPEGGKEIETDAAMMGETPLLRMVRVAVVLFMLFISSPIVGQEFVIEKGKNFDVFYATEFHVQKIVPIEPIDVRSKKKTFGERILKKHEKDTLLFTASMISPENLYRLINYENWPEEAKKDLIRKIKAWKPINEPRILLLVNAYKSQDGTIIISMEKVEEVRTVIGGEYIFVGTKLKSNHVFANPIKLISWINKQKWSDGIKAKLTKEVRGSQSYKDFKEAYRKSKRKARSGQFSLKATVVVEDDPRGAFQVTIMTEQADKAMFSDAQREQYRSYEQQMRGIGQTPLSMMDYFGEQQEVSMSAIEARLNQPQQPSRLWFQNQVGKEPPKADDGTGAYKWDGFTPIILVGFMAFFGACSPYLKKDANTLRSSRTVQSPEELKEAVQRIMDNLPKEVTIPIPVGSRGDGHNMNMTSAIVYGLYDGRMTSFLEQTMAPYRFNNDQAIYMRQDVGVDFHNDLNGVYNALYQDEAASEITIHLEWDPAKIERFIQRPIPMFDSRHGTWNDMTFGMDPWAYYELLANHSVEVTKTEPFNREAKGSTDPEQNRANFENPTFVAPKELAVGVFSADARYLGDGLPLHPSIKGPVWVNKFETSFSIASDSLKTVQESQALVEKVITSWRRDFGDILYKELKQKGKSLRSKSVRRAFRLAMKNISADIYDHQVKRIRVSVEYRDGKKSRVIPIVKIMLYTNDRVLADNAELGGIDLEKTTVTRANGGQGIKINFKANPAMLEQLRNATGLHAIINIKPITVPALNGLLGLNDAQPDDTGFDGSQEVAALKRG